MSGLARLGNQAKLRAQEEKEDEEDEEEEEEEEKEDEDDEEEEEEARCCKIATHAKSLRFPQSASSSSRSSASSLFVHYGRNPEQIASHLKSDVQSWRDSDVDKTQSCSFKAKFYGESS